MHFQSLKNDYEFLPLHERIEMLSILYYGNSIKPLQELYALYRDNVIDYLDSEVVCSLPRKIELKINGISLHRRNDDKVNHVKASNKEADEMEEKPYEIRINGLNAPEKVKRRAFDFLKQIQNSNENAPKAQKYLDGLLRIPFGKLTVEPGMIDRTKNLKSAFSAKYPTLSLHDVSNNNVVQLHQQLKAEHEKHQIFLQNTMKILDQKVHGHQQAKVQLQRLIAQWISGGQNGLVLGIQGPPGNGKTTLIKNALASCMLDENNKARPVGFIPLGGSSKGNILEGHSYTYQGSRWGRIVDILMDSKCMNPILLFDELDKVQSHEIIGILTHLTDPSQNYEFNDRYFDGIPIDLSKALMVFTFNDASKIDPILLDRITLIRTKPLTIQDKIDITRKHLLPEITHSVGIMVDDIMISNKMIKMLVANYTAEAGVRQLKRLLKDLIGELNLQRLQSQRVVPMAITSRVAKKVFEHLDKPRLTMIPTSPILGEINGMYANILGMGGILPIQVKFTKGNNFNLILTGMQGEVMKESMSCAKTVAWSLLDCSQQKDLEDNPRDIHVHCPSTSTPKDGPSAGGAICLAMYSIFVSQKPKPNVSMTGEIDLQGNITAIGGLGAKLHGAKKAGVTTAVIPKENKLQLERLRKNKESPEDRHFKVVLVDNVLEAKDLFFD